MDSVTRSKLLAELRSKRLARKAADDEIKAARNRLARGSSVRPELEHELLTRFARNELGAAITTWALSAIFALASMFWAPWIEGSVWLVLAIGSKVILLELCRRFLASNSTERETTFWRRRLVMAELLCGMTWAGFALVGSATLPAASDIYSSHVFIFAALIVLLSIRLSFAATVTPILYVGTIPMTVAVVGRLVVLGDPFYLALATMAIGVHLYFMFLASGLRQTALQMLEFRLEKDMLIADLDEERSICEEARHRAEAASVAKSRFLATMSHELRTPLNAIMGFSEVMKDELFGTHSSPVYREYASDIHESGRHLLQLINEILDLSRIEAGRYELHEERAHLGDIAQECHRLLSLKARSKGLEIIEEIDESLPQVWVDVRAVRQIVLNLLSNAVKFTPKGGSIIITVGRQSSGGQLLSVRDTGPGIPAEEIPTILQTFGQGSLAHETAEGGTGLGLPIVKSLIELHGGQFQLNSELRKGTEVTVTVPPARVLETMPPLQPLGKERHRRPPPQPSPRPPRLRPLQPAQSQVRRVGETQV